MTLAKSSFGSGAGQAAEAQADVLAGSALAGGAKRKKAAGKAGSSKPGCQRGAKQKTTGARGSLIRHDFVVAFKQLVPFLLVAIAAFAVAMPVSTAAIPDASIFNLDYTHDQMKFRFWAGELTYPVVLGAALYGVLLGLRAFHFLLVKCETTAVLSLPMPRTSVYGARFGACMVALVLGIGLPLAASLVVNIAALNIWTGLFEQWAYVFCGLALTGAVACAVTAAACAVAGTVAEAVSFSAALLASVSVAAWGLNSVMDFMLVGNAFGARLYSGTTEVAQSLLAASAQFNPLLFFVQEAADHQQFIVQHPVYYPVAGNWALLACWLVALAVVVAVGVALIKRRRGERAGIAGLSVPLAVVVGIVVGLAAFGVTFTLLASLNVAAAVIGSFAVFLLVSLVLFRGPLKGSASLKRTLATIGAEAAALAGVVALVGTGGLGYAQAVPAADEVASVSVSYTGSPNFLAAQFETAKAGSGAYYFSAEYTFDDEQAIDIVRGVHQDLIDTGRAQLGTDRFNTEQTVVPYDVVLRYTLSDGSQLVRYYSQASYAELAALAGLDDTAKVKGLERAVVSGDASTLSDDDFSALGSSSARQAYAMGDIYIADRLYASPMLVNCDAAARAELLAALAEDVANQSADDRYHPAGACRGVVMFTQSGNTAAESFAYNIENTLVYLTDEYTNTLAWFHEKGLDGYLALSDEASRVQQTTVQHFDVYDGMNAPTEPQSIYFQGYKADVDEQFINIQDFGTKFSTTDAGEIAELLPLARNAYYLDQGGYLLSCKLAGQDAYTYLVIPESEAPEWLVRVAG